MQAKGIAHFGLLCTLSLFSGFSNAMPISNLLISEIMANPDALSDTRGEWFELYNPTSEVINLNAITFGDDGRDLHRIESDLLILPSEYLTLARYHDPGFVPDYVYNDFILGNTEDEIVFSDGITELLRLEYGGDFAEVGHSRELGGFPMIASNYDLTPAALEYGSGDIGSPGEAGSFGLPITKAPLPTSAVPLPATAWLFIGGILMLLVATALSRRYGSSSHRTHHPVDLRRPNGRFRWSSPNNGLRRKRKNLLSAGIFKRKLDLGFK